MVCLLVMSLCMMLPCTGPKPASLFLSSSKDDAEVALLRKEGVSFPDEEAHT